MVEDEKLDVELKARATTIPQEGGAGALNKSTRRCFICEKKGQRAA